MLTLRPYQLDCLKSIEDHANLGNHRQLVNIATGGGKTIIFANLIKERNQKALILVHTCELLHQAKDKINMVAPYLDVGIVNADRKEFGHEVVVASIQSARVPANLSELKKIGFQLLIADECHHFASDISKNILDALDFGKETNNLLVGFTATAFRNDSKGLGEIFDIISYEMDTRDLIDAGYLCPPSGFKIKTDIDLSKVKRGNGDFQAKSLSAVMNTTEMNHFIVDSYLEKGEGRKALCFTTSVQHAINLSYMFRQREIATQAIYGEMPMCEREAILKDFKEGHITVICNCQVLTEGFDAPNVSCIIVGRPTKSRGLYQQMVGRGLRPYPNKKDCIVLDFCDRNHSICNAGLLLNDSENIEEDERESARVKEVKESIPPNLNQKLKAAILSFDPLGDAYTWQLDNSIYSLNGSNSSLSIIPNDLDDQYKVIFSTIEGQTILAQGFSFEYAFSVSEEFAKKNESLFVVNDRNAPWRDESISEKQILTFKKRGFIAGVNQLSKGQASDLIGSGALRRKR